VIGVEMSWSGEDRPGRHGNEPRSTSDKPWSTDDKPQSAGNEPVSISNHCRVVREKHHLLECCWCVLKSSLLLIIQ